MSAASVYITLADTEPSMYDENNYVNKFGQLITPETCGGLKFARFRPKPLSVPPGPVTEFMTDYILSNQSNASEGTKIAILHADETVTLTNRNSESQQQDLGLFRFRLVTS